MNLKRILISIAIGTFCYACISLIFGESGILAEKQLQSQKDMLVANINKIQTAQDMLVLKQRALTEDMDVIASYAKQIGYISEGERLLKISGIPNSLPKQIEIGKKYLKTEIVFVEEWIIKSCGIFLFFLSYIVHFLLTFNSKAEYRKKQEVFYAYS